MSTKNKVVFLTFEIDSRFSRLITKFSGKVSLDDLDVFYQVLDDLGLKVYDHYEIKNYIPTKEDFEK